MLEMYPLLVNVCMRYEDVGEDANVLCSLWLGPIKKSVELSIFHRSPATTVYFNDLVTVNVYESYIL